MIPISSDENNILSAAIDCVTLGFSVTPARNDDPQLNKQPRLRYRGKHGHATSYEQVLHWWGTEKKYAGSNILLLTGRESGLVCVDCDTPQAVAWAEEHLPPTTFRVATSRGEHRWYRYPEPELIEKHGRTRDGQPWLPQRLVAHHPGGERIDLDIKADGNYAVAPGSVHKSGRVYEIVGGLSLEEAYAGAPQFDEACFKALEQLCFCKSDTCTGALRGFRESDKTVTARAEDKARRAEWEARKARGEAQGDFRHHDVSGSEAFRRAWAYVDRIPGGVQGQKPGREPRAFALACRLARGFDLPDHEVLHLLRVWNVKNEPMLPDRVLEQKAEGARIRGTESIGSMLRNDKKPHKHSESCGCKRDKRDKIVPPSIRNKEAMRRDRYARLIAELVNEGKKKRVKRLAGCATCVGLMSCSEHGPQGVKRFTCGSPGCYFCQRQRARQHREHILEKWPERIAVLEVDLPLAIKNGTTPLSDCRRLKNNQIRKALRGAQHGCDQRWLLGTETFAMFAPEDRKQLLKRTVRELKEQGIKAKANVLTRYEVAVLVEKVWVEPCALIDRLLEDDTLPDEVVMGRLKGLELWDPEVRIVRTRGNVGGEALFPWLSIEAMTAKLVAEAREKRGGCAWNECSHEHEDGSRCCKTMTCTVYVQATGELVGEFDTDTMAWQLNAKVNSLAMSIGLDPTNFRPPPNQ